MKKKNAKQKKFKRGFGTVEIVILTAILIGLALLFKNFIVEYATKLINSIKSVEINITEFLN